MKQRELSKWLKLIIVVAAACCIALGAFLIPVLGREEANAAPELAYLFWPCLIFFWITELVVLAAFWQAWLIFSEIGRDNSFCMENARRLRTISRLAIVDSVLYAVCTIVLVILGAMHPGVLLIFAGIVLVGLAIAIASAALSHLTQKAASLKDENDLTI